MSSKRQKRWIESAALWLTLVLLSVHAAAQERREAPEKPPAVEPAPPADPPTEAPSPPAEEPTAPEDPPATEPAESPADEPSPPPGVVPPRLIEEVSPEYPARAREERVAASVTVELEIDAAGTVANALVRVPAEADGYGFDDAALAAAYELRFEPARRDDKPVAVRIHYTFHFVPEATPPPAEPRAPPAEPQTRPAQQAQQATGQLSGTLAERGTRTPLAGVKVTIFRGSGVDAVGYETETDAAGNFRFVGLTTGEWQILADPEGYYPVRERERVTEGQRTDVRYLIEKRSYNPYDVVVDAKRVRREVTRHSIDTAQADRTPGTFGDVLSVVKNFPGVARTEVIGQEGVVIRGSAPEDSKQFIEGMHIPQVYHFGGLRSVLTVGMTDHIDFYPGNFSSHYGRATGGVIDVGLTPLQIDAPHGYADISVFDTSLYFETPITDKLALAVGGRRSYIDFVIRPFLSGNGTIAPRYYDAQALVRYRPAPGHQISGFFMLSDDAFRLVLDEPIDADAETTVSQLGFFANFYRGLAEYRYVPGPRMENRVQLSVGRDYFNIALGDAEVDVRTVTGQARETWRYAWSDAIALTLGGDYLLEQVDGQGRLPALPREGDADQEPDITRNTDVDIEGTYHSTAVFGELELRPFMGTLLLPSVRSEHFSRTQQLAISPRFSLRQALTDAVTLKAGAGHFVQEPEFLETDDAVGNPDLGLKQAIHYSAGVEYVPLPPVTIDATLFYKTLWAQVSHSDAVVERDGELVPENLNNEGRGRVRGLELSLKHELSNRLFAWLAYTLSRAERKDAGSNEYRLFDYDQTHILTVLASYRLPRNWEVSTRWRYVTGNVYTPFDYGVFDADADEYRGVTGAVNSARASPFHQLDIRVDKRWIYDSWILGAYLDLQNVYNRANEDGVEYNYDYTTSQGNTGLPIIPVLGLRGEF